MKFTGEFEFLSNFYPSVIPGRFGDYPTVEHFFQAMKTDNIVDQEKIRTAETPGKAKRLGRRVQLRSDWDLIKLGVMWNALFYKFMNPELARRLLAVEGEIVEDNNWGDTFWGVCNGKGENILGKMLMDLRDLDIIRHAAEDI